MVELCRVLRNPSSSLVRLDATVLESAAVRSKSMVAYPSAVATVSGVCVAMVTAEAAALAACEALLPEGQQSCNRSSRCRIGSFVQVKKDVVDLLQRKRRLQSPGLYL